MASSLQKIEGDASICCALPIQISRLSPLTFDSCNRFHLHVIDLDPSSVTSGCWLEDTSLVEKYTISEEADNKREGMLSFPPSINLSLWM